MNLRKDVIVEDIPIVWTTNLSDEEIREFYAIIANDPDLDASKAEAHGASFRLRFYHKTVNFKDGYCLCHGMGKYLGVIYRSDEDWELWEARRVELEELKEEQQAERVTEEALFRGQDDYLRQEIENCLSEGRYDQACELLDRRFAMRKDIEDEQKQVGSIWQLRFESIGMFSRFPTTDAGIRFLEQRGKISYEYILLADRYHYQRRSSGEEKWIEIEKIFRAATVRFPDDGPLVKHTCLFWVRQLQLYRAVEYCQLGIDRNLKDDTVNGFPGRMKRLKKKLANLAL